jgi:flagellar biosynthesis chaperone FliJ
MSGQYNAGDDNLQSMEEGGTGNQSQNQNPLIQSLKTAIKTMSSEIETLEEKCIDIEDR